MQDGPIWRDLNSAMIFKGQHPDYALIVSIESSSNPFDEFWSDPEIGSLFDHEVVLLRLTDTETPNDIQQFVSIFPFASIPSLVIFDHFQAKVSKSWSGTFPSKADLLRFFNPSKPKPQPAISPIPHKPPPKFTKLSVQTAARTIVREFPNEFTIRELRVWLRSEFGSDIDFIVTHKHASLPTDGSLTLFQADLSPSAVLREPAPAQVLPPANNLPGVRHEVFQPPQNGILKEIVGKGKFVWSLLNPWDEGDNSDDCWEYQPRPDLVKVIRRSARLMARVRGD
jgi:hypothetical protein